MEKNPIIEISETNRGKEQIIIDKKYKFNLSSTRKDNSKIYKCTEYRTINKCKSFVILNDKKEILTYESLHNHSEKEFDVSVSIMKHKIKDKIRKNSIPFEIKPKRIFNEVSQEMGYICPEYNSIKSQIKRNINKELPPDIKTFDKIPEESDYYKIKGSKKSLMIFKNNKIIIFQSPHQAMLFKKYKDIFVDGTFQIAPPLSYQ
eukprot:jgi/Orpsp1_1/1189408/evm.model.d7180000071837.1